MGFLGIGLAIGVISHYFWQILREFKVITIEYSPHILACDFCFATWVSSLITCLLVFATPLSWITGLICLGYSYLTVYFISKDYWA